MTTRSAVDSLRCATASGPALEIEFNFDLYSLPRSIPGGEDIAVS